MTKIFPFISGFIFSIGLGISQMTKPEKVIGFLNMSGDWDPSLLVVLISAVFFYGSGNYLLKKREEKTNFKILPPIKTHIDRPLLFGSALFGIGWGLFGLCPGPALTDLATGNEKILAFLLAMSTGMLIADKVDPYINKKEKNSGERCE